MSSPVVEPLGGGYLRDPHLKHPVTGSTQSLWSQGQGQQRQTPAGTSAGTGSTVTLIASPFLTIVKASSTPSSGM